MLAEPRPKRNLNPEGARLGRPPKIDTLQKQFKLIGEGPRMSQPSILVVTQPLDYFRQLVTAALNTHQLKTQPETEFYLVNLLNDFMTTERLYTRYGDGSVQMEPLALQLQTALQQPEPQVRRCLLRQIGDVSLYVAGYFQESLNRKVVDVDYYIEMGGLAYRKVADQAQESLNPLFTELAEKFALLVEVLAEVAEWNHPKTERDLLRVYDLWIKTRSQRAERALSQAGILPNSTLKSSWQ